MTYRYNIIIISTYNHLLYKYKTYKTVGLIFFLNLCVIELKNMLPNFLTMVRKYFNAVSETQIFNIFPYILFNFFTGIFYFAYFNSILI